jgi:hypothetical protein
MRLRPSPQHVWNRGTAADHGGWLHRLERWRRRAQKEGNMDGIVGLIISLISGAVGGAILMIIVGLIKQAVVR